MTKQGTGFREFLKKNWNKENGKAILQYLFAAVFINLLIELLSRRSFGNALEFAIHEPSLFLLGALLILFTLSFSLLTRRRGYWFFFISLAWLGIGIADFVQRTFRSMPITASDIFLMSSVKDIFELYLSYAQLSLIMIAIAVVIGILFFLWYASKKRDSILIFGISTVLFTGALLFIAISMLLHSGALEPTKSFNSLPRAYKNNGFAYCFSASMVTRGVNEPEDYSHGEVEELLDEAENELPQTAEHAPNIIFVQLESFFDPKYLKGLKFEYDPIPNFTALKDSCSTGLLSVPAIGAGTANTEFEVLSGMNLSHFGVGEYPYMTIVDSDFSESVCYALGSVGYSTHAIHNNNATFYDRHIVYDHLGFHSFTSLEYMDDVSFNPRGWSDDSVLTEEIKKCLTSTQSKDFIFAVSVQAHGKYPAEPLDDAPVLGVEGIENEGRKNGFEYYLYQLYECDRFIAELLAALRTYDEPTAVVLYGDHLPSFNIEDSEITVGDSQTTEYVIWTNFESEKKHQDLQTYQLAAYVLEYCGIYEGVIFRLHQSYEYASDSDEAYQDALQMLEYDIIDGDHYHDEGDRPLSQSKMRFDVEDISVSGIRTDPTQEGIYITGSHFTPYSMVYINDTAYETVFVSDNRLLVSDVSVQEGDVIQVAQISASDDLQILSLCEPFVFTQ